MPRSLTDNPVRRIDADLFGFRPYIEELHDLVDAAQELPLTVGVFGSWGTGKSSFLHMWRDLLAPQTRTVWFNPWKYDQKVQVWAALLHSLLAEIREQSQPGPVREKAAALARAAMWLGVRGAAGVAGALATAATGGLIDRGLFRETLEQLADEEGDHYRELNRFEEDFSDAVSQFVGADGRLVVFVDDLDRCTPEAALNVLEAMKLFIGDARCVFVLAMDFDLIGSVAARKFGDLSGAADPAALTPITGAAYLEKLVQVPFFLPEISAGSLRSALHPHAGPLGDDEALWGLIWHGLGANPRRVKRFLNVFDLTLRIATRKASEHPIPRQHPTDGHPNGHLDRDRQLQLAKLLLLRGEHRGFFHRLRENPGLWAQVESSPALPHPDGRPRGELTMEPDPVVRQVLETPVLGRLLAARPGEDFPDAPEADQVGWMIQTVARTTGDEHDRRS